MTTTEPECHGTPEGAGLRVERLPFERIPQQSRLFLDYLKDPTALRRFYPEAVRFHYELDARARRVLDNQATDRTALCDALESMNARWNAGQATLENIKRLRLNDCVAVVTGQQVGLFTGPLYTLYKALSAVKLAACLSSRETPAVPVFWMATEDHDWDEVRRAEVIACDGRLAGASVPDELHREGEQVGGVVLSDSIGDATKRLFELLPSSEFLPRLETLLRDCYRPGRTFGEAFALMLSSLTSKYGLVLLDPTDRALKRLAAPLYSEAARRAAEIAAATDARSRALVEAGYHAQVHTSPDAFPLFLVEGGARRALTRTGEGRYRSKGTEHEWTAEELSALALREPERFSPNVTLRAVVQDYLLPTVAYFGGSAEIAYFAQTAESYRVLSRPATPILHRASITVVERRAGRTLERYGLKLEDFFGGLDSVVARVVEEHLGTEIAGAFDSADASVARALDKLETSLRAFDPTLADALTGGRKKISHQLDGLRSRFHRAQAQRDRAAMRQLERAATSLYPEKALQERHVNVTSLLARHGRYVVEWIHDSIDLSTNDHQIVYL
ncbi:MAG TPA: bacillithiol biosynthesis cysteine-adding enzyme BshC [Pyrinomonadaceae bacterium]|nr:bacillithiol biosynthesis cysteine-adding enzyme BshC [Pyrinomonadaceae bacterium]